MENNRLDFDNPQWEDFTKIFGDLLIEVAKTDSRVIFVGADSYRGGGAISYRNAFPDRFIELGVAEQNACGHAAGLAFAGKKPFFSAIANFSTGRCFEQVRDDIARTGLNVVILGRAAGISYGTAGPTHHSIDDFAVLRALPKMTIADPADYNDFKNMLFEAIKLSGPVYIRKHKQVIKKINPDTYNFKFGKGVVLKEGGDLAIIACGTMVYQSYWAAHILKNKGIDAAVVNMHTIKPLDTELLNSFIESSGKIVTAEEHTIINGLGSAVSDEIAKKGSAIQLKIGFNDEWPTDGPYLEVLEWHGLTGPKIAERIEKWIKG